MSERGGDFRAQTRRNKKVDLRIREFANLQNSIPQKEGISLSAHSLERTDIRVAGNGNPLTEESLKNTRIYVIANAIPSSKEKEWVNPIPSAFSKEETSLLEKWVRGGNAHIPVIEAKGLSQGAVRTYGKGRIAVFGEAAIFSSQVKGPDKIPFGFTAPEAKYNQQFLLNIIHWLDNKLN